jgi:hypothetical protein
MKCRFCSSDGAIPGERYFLVKCTGCGTQRVKKSMEDLKKERETLRDLELKDL